MKLKHIFFTLAAMTFFSTAQAQVKVGANPGTINPSAALEIESTNKGFLPPRVALTGTADVATIPSPAAGLMVFNTTAAGSGATGVEANRLYFWDGLQWVKSTVETNSSTVRTSLYAYKYFTIDASAPTNSVTTVGNISIRWPYTALGLNQKLQIRYNDQPDYVIIVQEQQAVPSPNHYTQSSVLDIAQNTWADIPGGQFNSSNQDWYRATIVKVQERAVYRIIAQFNYAQPSNSATGRGSILAGCTLIIEKLN